MKIRQGFISNSSTTSFCIYGACLDDDQMPILESKEDLVNKFGLEEHRGECGDHYIGRSWDRIKDDETGAQFKESIRAALKEIFGKDFECHTIEEAYRDG